MKDRSTVRPLQLLALLALACDAPAPTDIRFSIDPVLNCQGFRPEIRSVRLTIIGARASVECIEEARCLLLERRLTRIGDVQENLPAGLSFDLLADRGYQFEAVGFGTSDCTLASSFGNYRFCGQSDVVKFDHDQTVSIPVRCSSLEVPDCAGLNASLKQCR